MVWSGLFGLYFRALPTITAFTLTKNDMWSINHLQLGVGDLIAQSIIPSPAFLSHFLSCAETQLVIVSYWETTKHKLACHGDFPFVRTLHKAPLLSQSISFVNVTLQTVAICLRLCELHIWINMCINTIIGRSCYGKNYRPRRAVLQR